MESPDVYHLSRLHWQLFCSLTFRRVPSAVERWRRIMKWLRWLAEAGDSRFRVMLWVVRTERGEIGARLHHHVLVGGLGAVNISLCFVAMNAWTSGWARVRLFEEGRAGVKYLAKGLGWSGEDVFETRRFSGDRSQLTVSKSVDRVLAAAARRDAASAMLRTRATQTACGQRRTVTASGWSA